MENFKLSEMFSPTKLVAKLNSLITWVNATFLTSHQPIKTLAGNTLTGTGNVSIADLGLGSVLKLRGKSLTALTDGATTSPITLEGGTSLTPTMGDTVLYDKSEFAWSGASWTEMGPDLAELRDIAEVALVM